MLINDIMKTHNVKNFDTNLFYYVIFSEKHIVVQQNKIPKTAINYKYFI